MSMTITRRGFLGGILAFLAAGLSAWRVKRPAPLAFHKDAFALVMDPLVLEPHLEQPPRVTVKDAWIQCGDHVHRLTEDEVARLNADEDVLITSGGRGYFFSARQTQPLSFSRVFDPDRWEGPMDG